MNCVKNRTYINQPDISGKKYQITQAGNKKGVCARYFLISVPLKQVKN